MKIKKGTVKNHLVGATLWMLTSGYSLGMLFIGLAVSNLAVATAALAGFLGGLINFVLHHGAETNERKQSILITGLFALIIGLAFALTFGIRVAATLVGIIGLGLVIRGALRLIAHPNKNKKDNRPT